MLQSATEENERLKKELESFASGDAAVLETIWAVRKLHEAVNRWTDNTPARPGEKKCGDRSRLKFFKEHGVTSTTSTTWNDAR